MKEKPSFTEALLKQSGTLKDYFNAKKLYEQYNKEKSKGKINPKTLEKLTMSLKEAEVSIGRIVRVYEKQSEAIKSEVNDPLVIEDDHTNYLDKLKEYYANVLNMQKELNITPKDSKIVQEGGSTQTNSLLKPFLIKPKQEMSMPQKKEKATLDEIFNSSSAQIDKMRTEAREKLKAAGYTSKDLENPNKEVSEFLESVSSRIDMVRTETRKKIADAGYSENDISEHLKRQEV